MYLKLLAYIFGLFFLMVSCKHKHYEKNKIDNAQKTYILAKNDTFQLIRNNVPYQIKGAVGNETMELIKELGGNSIRTYTLENADAILKKADSLQISVTLGIWLQHIDYFDYSDKLQKERKLRQIKRFVLRYKNSPALLMWCIGNEFQMSRNPNIEAWKFVNEISKMIHEIDPNHPTTTAIAGYPRKHLPIINLYCNDLDLLSFNKFGEIKSIQEKMQHPIWGYNGPYLLSELGSTGFWDSYLENKWGMPTEEYDLEKALCIKKLFTEYRLEPKIIGSYIFYWGQKQEYTPTWLNLFGKNGEQTAMLEEVYFQWSGKRFENSLPIITKLQFTEKNLYYSHLKPETTYELSFEILNDSKQKLNFEIELLPESRMKKDIHGVELKPESIPFEYTLLQNKIIFKTPQREGKMRLFLFVKNEFNAISSANIAFYIVK